MAHDTIVEINACLEQLRTGDRRAFGRLIARAQERLRRLANKSLEDFARVRRFEDADDVLQNSLLRLLRRLEAHTPATAAAFFALAAQEIRRELLDLVRHYFGPLGRGRREVPPPEADPAASSVPPAVDPGDQTRNPERLMLWTELHEHVERLPAAERCVFELRWYHGLSWAEAAEVLNMSEATVKRRWQDARRLLREWLSVRPDDR
jgi:RNA polymerase sigma-70 factor (ECF subfamily)